MLVASYFLIQGLLPETWSEGGQSYSSIGVFWATISGLIAGLLVGKITRILYWNWNKARFIYC